MRPEHAPFALRWRCLRYMALSSRCDCVVSDHYWSICDARDPITIRSPQVGCNLMIAGGVLMRSSMYNARRTSWSIMTANNFRIGFLILISFFDNVITWRSILMCNNSTIAGTSLEGTPMFAHVTLHRIFNPLGSKYPWWQDEEVTSKRQ